MVVVMVVVSLVLVRRERLGQSLSLIIRLTRDRWGGIQTPSSHNILSLLLWWATLLETG